MIFQKNDIINENKETKPMFLNDEYKFSPLIENFDFINTTLLEGEEFLNEAMVVDKLVNNYIYKGEDFQGLKGRLGNIIKLNKISDKELTMNPIYCKQAMEEATGTSNMLSEVIKTVISTVGAIGLWKLIQSFLAGKYSAGYDAGFVAGKKYILKWVLIIALCIVGLTIIVAVIYVIWKKKKALSNEEKSCVNETIGNIEHCKSMVSVDSGNTPLVKKFDGMISKLKETLK